MRKVYFIDLFCGAGGVTSGIHRARYNGQQFAQVIACVNHDPLAIQSHEENHPDVLHYTEDIRTLDLTDLRLLVEMKRKMEPDCLLFIWASLECTNFSKAKGGKPRDAGSRTLAEHMPRYLEALKPDGMWIENVVEFMAWGPLNEQGKPVSRQQGVDYLRWVKKVMGYGYNFVCRVLNSADFGAYTSRSRYFAQFMRPGLPMHWPVATHAKNPSGGSLFGSLEKWKAVKDVLDFSDEGQSIFTDLYPKSMKGAKAYLSVKRKKRKKAVIHTIAVFPAVIKEPVFGMEPKLILTAKDFLSFDKKVAAFVALHGPVSFYRYDPYSEQTFARIYAGLVKFVAGGKDAFIAKYYSGDQRSMVVLVESPAPTVRTKDSQALVQPAFLSKYYGNGDNVSGLNEPAGTITTKDRFTKVQTVWLDKYYSGAHNHQPITQPAGAILTNDKHALITTERGFLMGTNYDNKPTSLFAPAPTVTASRKWSYLVNPSWGGCPTGTDQPSPVIVARQDKAPMYLVQTESGQLGIQIYESDSPMLVKIKEFMAAYGIIDIKMRMLKIAELLRIQGFGDGYVLKGNQADQKRFIGNAVEVNQARVLIEAFYKAVVEHKALKTA